MPEESELKNGCKNTHCVSCGKERSTLKEIAWAHAPKFECKCGGCLEFKALAGFICMPCEDKRKEQAIADYKPEDNGVHHYNCAPICPYCGHVKTVELEDGLEDFETECTNCGSEYKVDVEVEVTYNTSKKE